MIFGIFVEYEAFRGCISLDSIFLPAGLEKIGDNAFADCGNMVIRGKAGSLAEQYAKANNITFIAV